MYTIIENQLRPDGVTNQLKETRSTFATALSFFYERASKMCVTELYTKVYITLLDESLREVEYKELDTQYKGE